MQTLSRYLIDYDFIKKFDYEFLKDNLILPFFNSDEKTICAVCKDSYIEVCKTLFFNEIIFITVCKNEILFYLSNLDRRFDFFQLGYLCIESKNLAKEYICTFFTNLIEFSIQKRSSDIHMETNEDFFSFRLRVDGKLIHFFNLPKEFFKILSSYLKLSSNLDITQFRKPLDGSFSIIISNKKWDLRLSFMPTIYGESIVIRILNSNNEKKDLKTLEFSKDSYLNLELVKKLTQGLVLICGPTNSGKSTTLYALLNELNSKDKKIITVEDPVEYKIQGVQQINVQKDLGLDFSTILKNILRQDPDIILIGEIRDKESLNIAIQASLTGHLVLSTLHANSALNAFSRLVDLGADRFLLVNTLKYIFYQRLAMKICTNCNFKACKECNYTKYKGRTVLSEYIKVDEFIANCFYEKEFEKLKTYLKTKGFVSIYEDGKNKAKKSITTLDEVYNVLGFEDEV